MTKKKADSHNRKIKRSLNGRILRSTTFNILILVIVCCVIMALSMQSLANNILLDSLQPMARQSAKTVEANIHMLADRMMTIAGDSRMRSIFIDSEEDVLFDEETTQMNRENVLVEAAEIYEFYTIALYDLDGQLVQGISGAPERLDSNFYALLQTTDNLTTDSSTIFQKNLGITMGMPVKEDGETILYVVGVYKYDTLNDVINNINIGKHSNAYMVNREGNVVAHPDQSIVLAGSTLIELNGENENMLRHVTTGETGAIEIPIDETQTLVAFSPVRGTQWSLVIQIPKSDYNHLINTAMMVAILSTIAVLFLSMLLVLQLAQSISRPVKRVTSRMVALSDGDLHTKVVPVYSRDELQVLTQTLDDTVQSVNCYISDIQQVLTQIADGNLCVEPQVEYKGDFTLIQSSLHTIIQSMNKTLVGFHAAATRLAEMSEEMNGQSSQLHQASIEQNQSTEVLVQEVSHVKERLSCVTESTNQTYMKTEEITQCVGEANICMSSLSSAMDDINANTQEITKIAKSIEDIAFQTSILAINASVEAARAGSAGKGFAVVVDEVRQLATRSTKAAQEATEMVSGTRAIIQTGVELTAATAGSLQAISSVSDQISTISEQLVDAVQGQESALISMEERIEEISTIADRNLQNASGTKQSSELLAKEAEALQSYVKKFNLKEGRKR